MKIETGIAAIIIALGVAICTGCTASAHQSTGENFTMSGTPEGIKAFGDTLIGAIKTGKEKPNAHNQYMALRAEQERNVTMRASQPGFFQKLFGKGS